MRFRIPFNLGGLKIRKYLQCPVFISRQTVLKLPHIAQMSHISVFLTRVTLLFATLVLITCTPLVAKHLLRLQMDFLFEV